jgi:hypothetical protein
MYMYMNKCSDNVSLIHIFGNFIKLWKNKRRNVFIFYTSHQPKNHCLFVGCCNWYNYWYPSTSWPDDIPNHPAMSLHPSKEPPPQLTSLHIPNHPSISLPPSDHLHNPHLFCCVSITKTDTCVWQDSMRNLLANFLVKEYSDVFEKNK